MKLAQRVEDLMTQPAPERPLWQRVVLPFAGLILLALGLIGWLLPVIPGLPLAIVGAPFVLCFDRRAEQWGRDRMRRARAGWLRQIARWRAS